MPSVTTNMSIEILLKKQKKGEIDAYASIIRRLKQEEGKLPEEFTGQNESWEFVEVPSKRGIRKGRIEFVLRKDGNSFFRVNVYPDRVSIKGAKGQEFPAETLKKLHALVYYLKKDLSSKDPIIHCADDTMTGRMLSVGIDSDRQEIYDIAKKGKTSWWLSKFFGFIKKIIIGNRTQTPSEPIEVGITSNNITGVNKAFQRFGYHGFVPRYSGSEQFPSGIPIKVYSHDPQLAIEQYEAILDAGFTAQLDKSTQKTMMRYAKKSEGGVTININMKLNEQGESKVDVLRKIQKIADDGFLFKIHVGKKYFSSADWLNGQHPIIDLRKQPKKYQIEQMKRLAEMGVESQIDVPIPMGTKITVKSNVPDEALRSFSIKLNQGFEVDFDEETKNALNFQGEQAQTFDSGNELDVHSIDILGMDPKQLLAKVKCCFRNGVVPDLNDQQQVKLRQYIRKEGYEGISIDGIYGGSVRENMQVAQQLGMVMRNIQFTPAAHASFVLEQWHCKQQGKALPQVIIYPYRDERSGKIDVDETLRFANLMVVEGYAISLSESAWDALEKELSHNVELREKLKEVDLSESVRNALENEPSYRVELKLKAVIDKHNSNVEAFNKATAKELKDRSTAAKYATNKLIAAKLIAAGTKKIMGNDVPVLETGLLKLLSYFNVNQETSSVKSDLPSADLDTSPRDEGYDSEEGINPSNDDGSSSLPRFTLSRKGMQASSLSEDIESEPEQPISAKEDTATANKPVYS